VGIDGEDLRAQALVRHLDELGERLLIAVVELDLRLAGETAEVPLTLDQRVPRGEVLRQANEGVVDRNVAVRVVLRHHDTDDVRRLPERPVVSQALLEHREEDPALHRLKAVANIR